jgi:hypothetical protein
MVSQTIDFCSLMTRFHFLKISEAGVFEKNPLYLAALRLDLAKCPEQSQNSRVQGVKIFPIGSPDLEVVRISNISNLRFEISESTRSEI